MNRIEYYPIRTSLSRFPQLAGLKNTDYWFTTTAFIRSQGIVKSNYNTH